MMFKKIKLREYLCLILLIVIGYIFAVTQKYYVPDIIILRTFLLLLVMAFLVVVFFFINKPTKPLELSKTLSILLGVIVGAIIIVQHLIITFTPSIKNVIVFLVAIIVPFISGLIYKFIKKY